MQPLMFLSLKSLQDWCISRQLWWGHRIPVWYVHDDEAGANAAAGGVSQRYIVAKSEQEAMAIAKQKYGQVGHGWLMHDGGSRVSTRGVFLCWRPLCLSIKPISLNLASQSHPIKSSDPPAHKTLGAPPIKRPDTHTLADF